jgi:4a-hydroxytetrahydrobiopterin dehydratase
VTQQDVDLARRITEIAADHNLDANPSSVSVIELGLDTAHSAAIAPVWPLC